MEISNDLKLFFHIFVLDFQQKMADNQLNYLKKIIILIKINTGNADELGKI
jgi:hypothetical protein